MSLTADVKSLKTVKSTQRFNELNSTQKKVFSDHKFIRLIGVLSSKKCFMCKKKFNDVLYDHKWNIEYLFHLKSTHALDQEVVFEIMRKSLKDDN